MNESHLQLLQDYGSEVITALLPSNLFYSVILLCGFIGNAFVLFIYGREMNKGHKEARYFIPVLAFYDLMACVVSEVHFMSETYLWVSFRENLYIYCKLKLLLVIVTSLTSNSFLLVIAVQRYVKICRPFAKQMTLFWRRFAVVIVIIVNIVYSTPSFIVSGVQDSHIFYKNENITGKGCFTGNEQYPKFQLIYCGLVFFDHRNQLSCDHGFVLTNRLYHL